MFLTVLRAIVTPKNALYMAVVLVVCMALWKVGSSVYNAGKLAGAAEVQEDANKRVQLIARTLDDTKAELSEYKELYRREGQASLLASMEHAILVNRLQSSLEDLGKRLKMAQSVVQTKEVIKYVTVEADNSCVVPNGFVLLHDWSAAPESGTPPGPGNDAGEASGFALSQVAATITANNLECHARGEIIEAWQEWYAGSKHIIEKYNEGLK